MEAYRSVLGGDLTITTVGEVLGEQGPPEEAGLVLQATLAFDRYTIMGSDDPAVEPTSGGAVTICATVGTIGRAESVFAGLAGGGRIEAPLAPTFWSPAFGTCTDRFGVRWMVTVADGA